jgi:APA family basic amino acid/polyamine antiporter
MLPPIVARVNPRTQTPVFTTVVTGIVVSILSGVIPLQVLLDLTNVGTLAAFTIVCVGVLVLRLVNPNAVRPFRSPFFPAVPLLGAGLCLYLIFYLSNGTLWRFLIWFVIGAAVYASYGYRKSLLRP